MTRMINQIVRIMRSSRWDMGQYSSFLNTFFRKEPERPLGRWSREGDVDLKADYANMDSCGDVLCGKPDYFKKGKLGDS